MVILVTDLSAYSSLKDYKWLLKFYPSKSHYYVTV